MFLVRSPESRAAITMVTNETTPADEPMKVHVVNLRGNSSLHVRVTVPGKGGLI